MTGLPVSGGSVPGGAVPGDVREVAVPVATLWRSPEAPREVDAPAVADLPSVAAWADALDAELRRGLHGRVDTQLLLGEGVRVLEERDGWSRVAALMQPSAGHPDGYPGWVRTAHLGDPVLPTEGPAAVVMGPSAGCVVDAGPEIVLSFGTVLRVVDGDHGSVRVALPGGRPGVVGLGDVRVADDGAGPAYDAGAALGSAGRFLGSRYLWGGTSGWGLDCSGLVHLVLRAHGRTVPRDACDQAAALPPVPLGEVRPGDLYFFARPGEAVYHVGFVSRPPDHDGTRWMLHAPEGGGLLEDEPLAPHRQQTLVSAARPL